MQTLFIIQIACQSYGEESVYPVECRSEEPSVEVRFVEVLAEAGPAESPVADRLRLEPFRPQQRAPQYL